MAINETQKDQTLQEVIHWCENNRSEFEFYLRQAYWLDDVTKASCTGQMRAYGDVIKHCKKALEKAGKDDD